jgi:hypothetical protein
MAFTPVVSCRVCAGRSLEPIIDIGSVALTGVFPRAGASVETGPLVLVRCDRCQLVQLSGDYTRSTLYGDNYGYRSGLNQSMAQHLQSKVAGLVRRRPVGVGDVVIDIGSNDGTLLGAYARGPTLLGIDPTAAKFKSHYRSDIVAHADFFSRETVAILAPHKRASIVTSVAMFYDLPVPQKFVDDIAAILANDGIWHFEQSYLPAMLRTNGYDTICHEHLEYYGLRQVVWLLDRAGLKIVDVECNDVNGGSFAVTAMKGSGHASLVAAIIADEDAALSAAAWERFTRAVAEHRRDLRQLLHDLKAQGQRVLGLGASTKGNVILQACGIDASLLPCIGDVNPDKDGRLTPGTSIPIVSEEAALAQNPDVFLVLPWHFRRGLVEKHRAFLERGGRFLFPLPTIEWVSARAAE